VTPFHTEEEAAAAVAQRSEWTRIRYSLTCESRQWTDGAIFAYMSGKGRKESDLRGHKKSPSSSSAKLVKWGLKIGSFLSFKEEGDYREDPKKKIDGEVKRKSFRDTQFPLKVLTVP
jgi:hypothetical protein